METIYILPGHSIEEAIVDLYTKKQLYDFIAFRRNLIILLFGDDYAERISPDMLTDEKLLEAVRMLKEVY